VQAVWKHEGTPTMAKQSNVVALKNTTAIVNVERSVKSHNAMSKTKPFPIAKTDFNVAIDFTTCEPAEIMAIAVDAIVVTLQSRARQKFFAKENMGKDGKTPIKSFNMIVKENIPTRLNVKDEIVLKARTPGKSLLEKTGEYMKKLSPEERAAMLKQLAAMK
jgi:hypothetical protein